MQVEIEALPTDLRNAPPVGRPAGHLKQAHRPISQEEAKAAVLAYARQHKLSDPSG